MSNSLPNRSPGYTARERRSRSIPVLIPPLPIPFQLSPGWNMYTASDRARIRDARVYRRADPDGRAKPAAAAAAAGEPVSARDENRARTGCIKFDTPVLAL